jgi:hypothetical protein
VLDHGRPKSASVVCGSGDTLCAVLTPSLWSVKATPIAQPRLL